MDKRKPRDEYQRLDREKLSDGFGSLGADSDDLVQHLRWFQPAWRHGSLVWECGLSQPMRGGELRSNQATCDQPEYVEHPSIGFHRCRASRGSDSNQECSHHGNRAT